MTLDDTRNAIVDSLKARLGDLVTEVRPHSGRFRGIDSGGIACPMRFGGDTEC